MRVRIAALAGVLVLAGCGQDVPQPEKTVQQFMATEVQPTAEIYWNSVQWVSDEQGEREIVPRTDAEWEKVRAAAATLGQHGRLLAEPGYAQGRAQDWSEFAKGLVEVSALAEQAAVSKDKDKVFEVGGTLYNVCSACHQAYPPAQGIPGAGEAATPEA